MKKANKIIWGIVLVAAGVLLALNALNVTDFDILFDGWWTLFIIIPCTIGLFTERDKVGHLIGIAVGVFLLLCCLDILEFSMFWKLILPVAVLAIGLKLLFSGIFGTRSGKIANELRKKGHTSKNGCAAFSGCEINYNGQIFDGAELTAVFGGIDCDLREAVITEDCTINVTVVFGGIDILVPPNVNVTVSSTCMFGGISNEIGTSPDAPTVYITGLCVFGGVDIK